MVWKEKILVNGYAVDVVIVIRIKLLNVLKGRMSYALHILDDWCGDKKLSVNPDEGFALTLTRKCKVTLPEVLSRI